MHNLFFILLTTLAAHVFAKSQIALFSDENCQESLRGLEGPNGYPNGTCTDLRRNGPYGSFQVVGLDPGCTGMLLRKRGYGRDTPYGYANNMRSHHLRERHLDLDMRRLSRRNTADRLLQFNLRILQYRLLRRWRHR